jgi:adenine phosphoribosyltransferase
MSAQEHEVYPVTIAGLRRELPLFEVAPGVRIAILNILGDTELVQAVARALAPKIVSKSPDVLVTAEAKSIPLAHMLSVETGLPYVILRKAYKPYMGEIMEAHTISITTGVPQKLYLDQKDRALLQGKNVALVDDVISTGSTLQGMRVLMDKVNAKVVVQAAIFTEGDRAKWTDIIALGHLPVFVDESAGRPD